MTLELVEADQVRSGRGGKTKGQKYGKYAIAIHKHIPWIQKEIENSKEKKIVVKAKDMGKEMGGEFIKKDATSIYWGLKYVLFPEGIVVETGTHTGGDKLLILRLADVDDRLPPSLSKYLESGEEPGEESEPGEDVGGENVGEDLKEPEE
jgi:hypothetical protein